MNIVTIKRKYGAKETMGELQAFVGNAIFICDTLELPWIDNKHNISCIPDGTYDVVWTFSLSRMRWIYQLQKVPNRSGIQIHYGNFATGKKIDIDGCILLGSNYSDLDKNGTEDIINSKITTAAFERFMNKQPFRLVITDQ